MQPRSKAANRIEGRTRDVAPPPVLFVDGYFRSSLVVEPATSTRD